MQTQQAQQLAEFIRSIQSEVQYELQKMGHDEASVRQQVRNVYAAVENVLLYKQFDK